MKMFLVLLTAAVIAPTLAFADPSGLWSRTNLQGETHIRIAPEQGFYIVSPRMPSEPRFRKYVTGDYKTPVIPAQNILYSGTIEWMENPRNDTQNPNPDLRDRPLVGIQIFNDMEQLNPIKWGGSLYNPEDGRTYAGTLTIIDENTLELEGCAFIIFCQSDTWTRVNE